MMIRLCALVGLAAAQQCAVDSGSCKVTCDGSDGKITYDLSSYQTPAIGYFQVEDHQPSYFYYSICAPLDSSKINCPNPQMERARRLQSGGGPFVALQDWGSPCPSSGACTLSSNCATLGVESEGSCMANGTAGLICAYKGGSGSRSVDFAFVCNAAAMGEPSAKDHGGGSYEIILPGPAGCGKPGGAGPGSGGLSWGSLFCILFPIFVLLYLGVGVAYNVKVNEMELGVEAIPQLEYWKQVPGLVKDGCQFSYVHAKKAYVAFRDRNKDPALTATLKDAQDDDLAAALGS